MVGVVGRQLHGDLEALLQIGPGVDGGRKRTLGNIAAVALDEVDIELHLLRQRQLEEAAGLAHEFADGGLGDAVTGDVEEADLAAGAPDLLGRAALPPLAAAEEGGDVDHRDAVEIRLPGLDAVGLVQCRWNGHGANLPFAAPPAIVRGAPGGGKRAPGKGAGRVR